MKTHPIEWASTQHELFATEPKTTCTDHTGKKHYFLKSTINDANIWLIVSLLEEAAAEARLWKKKQWLSKPDTSAINALAHLLKIENRPDVPEFLSNVAFFWQKLQPKEHCYEPVTIWQFVADQIRLASFLFPSPHPKKDLQPNINTPAWQQFLAQ